jgi:Dolichyl-phosphate-mannose-protein mannosyltransferase
VTATPIEHPTPPPKSAGLTPGSLRLGAVVLAIAAIVGALVSTRHGPDLGPDSVTYLSAARNLVHGRGFTDFTEEPVTVFAPGYPAILAIGHFVGVGAESVGRVANALLVGAIALVSFFLLRRHVASPWITIGAAALAALSAELLRVAAFVATDPLFVLLTLVFIVLMEDIRTKPERRALFIVLAGLVASCAFLVRYAAVPLFVTGVIVLAAYSAKEGWRAIARRTISFSAVSFIAPGLWILRNATSGASDVLGIRVQSDDSPLTLARLLGESAKDLVFSYRVPAVAALAAVMGGLVLAASLAWRSRRDLLPRLSRTGTAMLPIVTLIVVATVFIVVAHKTTGSDLNARMLLPVWFPTIILSAWLLDNLLIAGRKAGLERLVRLLSAAMVAFLVGSMVWYFQQVAKGTSNAFHYSSENVTELKTVIRRLPASTQILSNDPWRVHIATGRQPVFLAPTEVRPSFSHRPISADEVADALCTEQGVLLWFDESPATRRGSVAHTLRRGTQIDLTDPRRVDGATLYTVERRENLPACS